MIENAVSKALESSVTLGLPGQQGWHHDNTCDYRGCRHQCHEMIAGPAREVMSVGDSGLMPSSQTTRVIGRVVRSA